MTSGKYPLMHEYSLALQYREAGFELREHEDGINLVLKDTVVARLGIHATIAEIERAAHQALCESQNGVEVNYG